MDDALLLHVLPQWSHQFLLFTVILDALHHAIRDHSIDYFQKTFLHDMRVIE